MVATLEFRGLDLLSALANEQRVGIRIQVVRGFLMPPAVRGEDYVVAAKAGQIPGNRVSDHLTIGLAGSVTGRDAEEWLGYRTDLLDALREGAGIDPGDLIARSPYLGLSTGAVASITARVDNVIEGPVEAKLRQTFSIELISLDPDWVLS